MAKIARLSTTMVFYIKSCLLDHESIKTLNLYLYRLFGLQGHRWQEHLTKRFNKALVLRLRYCCVHRVLLHICSKK